MGFSDINLVDEVEMEFEEVGWDGSWWDIRYLKLIIIYHQLIPSL